MTIAVRVDNLKKRFSGRSVLDGVSFDVNQGEILAVLGRSGTGKSVLLKTIIALYDPDAGRVEVCGRELHTLDEHGRLAARRELMGYVFQGAALFDSLNVLENVGFALFQARRPEAEIRLRVREALTSVGLEGIEERLPSQLSGGMQKRVGLARAVIDHPRVVLYDEPTTGLDPLTTDTINDIIVGLRNSHGVTSIMVTHDVRSALRISDRIIMLEQGAIIAQGTPAEILTQQDPWVRRFLGRDDTP